MGTGGTGTQLARRLAAAVLAVGLAVAMVATSSPASALLVDTDPVVEAALDEIVAGHDEGSYDDPYYLNWTGALPPISGDFVASTEDDCPKGQLSCVRKVVKEMTKRWDRLECNHNGPFALAYLLTTMQYYDATTMQGFFDDPEFVNHEDAVFADYYFRAYDAWYGGDVNDVPLAWQVAFSSNDAQRLQGMGSAMLGFNAHIRRDLPFVLAGIGLTAPDGSSRKADHDRVNEFLNEAGMVVSPRMADLYDPTITNSDLPWTTADQTTMLGIFQEWREEAWRKAELLVNASTDAERLAVAQWIENEAHQSAMAIADAYAYNGITNGTAAVRNDHCAAEWPNALDYLTISQDGNSNDLDLAIAEALAGV